MAIIFGLLGIKGTELQGDMKQCDRIEALSKFRKGEYDYLLATDLASRGLDIKEVLYYVVYRIIVGCSDQFRNPSGSEQIYS